MDSGKTQDNDVQPGWNLHDMQESDCITSPPRYFEGDLSPIVRSNPSAHLADELPLFPYTSFKERGTQRSNLTP